MFEEHLVNVEKIFRKLREFNIKVNLKNSDLRARLKKHICSRSHIQY
jgi:hypothetical protein